MTTITPAIAAHVLHHFDGDGIRAGSFTVRLIELITHADPTNRAKLALGFPGYVAGVDLAQNDLDGMTELGRIAADFGKPAPRPATPACPECQSGKHPNCVGFAFDAGDEEVDCPCAGRGHQ